MIVTPLPMVLPGLPGTGSENQNKSSGAGKTFGEMLGSALEEVNQSQIKADGMVKKFLIGEVQDIHQVTIAMEEARLMMQMAVEVRNKIVEAYQEVSRMQV
ncbi:MAG: flagellar hook-basal body complex protein FliE [Desulfocucumaceae bacterium]